MRKPLTKGSGIIMEVENKSEILKFREALEEERKLGNNLNEQNFSGEQKDYSNITPRYYQLKVETALKLKPYDLFLEGEDGRAHLSKGDIILIYSLFKGGVIEFYDYYIKYVNDVVKEKNYSVVHKPHYFLKNCVDNK